MNLDAFRKVIREEVKKAIQEEMRDVLLEAVKSPKTVVQETYVPVSPSTVNLQPSHTTVNHDLKRNLRSMIGGEFDAVITANSSHTQPSYTPPPSANTMSEGSSLPGGEVSLDQIMGLINNR